MNSKKFDAIIFDMDGVLVDTERYYLARREEFFNSQKVSIAHLSPSDFIGANMKDMWDKILLDQYSKAFANQLQADYNAYKAKHPLPYQDLLFQEVPDTLKRLKEGHYKIALASSSTMQDIQLMLHQNGLSQYFDALFSGADCQKSKPDPEIYFTAMKSLDVLPQNCLIIEDSQNGIAAGKATQATVWARKDDRFGMNQTAADAFIDDLSILCEKLL